MAHNTWHDPQYMTQPTIHDTWLGSDMGIFCCTLTHTCEHHTPYGYGYSVTMGFHGLLIKLCIYSKPMVIPWVLSGFGLNNSYYT